MEGRPYGPHNNNRAIEMVDLNQEQSTSPPIVAANMSNKKNELLSTAMERTSKWIFSLEIPSDITISINGASFSLHKFPLISKCGYIRKLVSNNHSIIKIPNIPGGAEAFALVTKFCYGANFEITIENVAMIRCAAEHLQMTEEYAGDNLITRTEAYINEVALNSIPGSVSILHSCEKFLRVAEKVKLVSRCIDSIASLACKDSQFATPDRAQDFAVLRIDLFQRVVASMMGRGLKQSDICPVLVLYAQKSLRGLEVFGKSSKKIDPRQEHTKRVVLETIVSLLPREKNAVPVSFLSMLLRAARYIETTVSCRVDLEKRMALQLGQATVEDVLIPSYSITGDTLFDADTVKRIMLNFLECEKEVNEDRDCSEIERVTKLMENYLSEISSDPNLSVSKFIGVAELIPEHARMTEDGMYSAIDIYLKAHPSLSEMERKKICRVMDCQKLSEEARAHVAQNDRLPVQTVVQVLYHEQQRLRQVLGNGRSQSPAREPTLNRYSLNVHPMKDETSSLRRENHDLKLELVRMKTLLKNMEKSSDHYLAVGNSPLERTLTTSYKKNHVPWKSFIGSVSRKFGRFIWPERNVIESSNVRNVSGRHRRHSVS